jgi:hypothetical protein
VIGGEKVRIAHGGTMNFDPRQSSHIHRWTTAVRPISGSDSFDRPRFGIRMLEAFFRAMGGGSPLEEQFGSAKRDRSALAVLHLNMPDIPLSCCKRDVAWRAVSDEHTLRLRAGKNIAI